MKKRFWVYIMADEPYGTLYTGFTNNIMRRAYEHREGLIEGHTKKHGIKMLVWYAEFPTALEAIAYEKKIKNGGVCGKLNSLKSSILNGKIFMKHSINKYD